jgi:hypothetical protein
VLRRLPHGDVPRKGHTGDGVVAVFVCQAHADEDSVAEQAKAREGRLEQVCDQDVCQQTESTHVW